MGMRGIMGMREVFREKQLYECKPVKWKDGNSLLGNWKIKY